MHCDHHHHEHDLRIAPERALRFAFILNFGFLIIEVIAGVLTNSLVLLSDAGHMVSDVAALALALFTERLVRLKPDGAFTFGFRRAPVLGAFGNALTLYIIVVLIFWEAWDRFIHPPEIAAIPVLLIGVTGLFVNGLSAYWLMKSHSQSLNIEGAMLHLFADALGSIGAIVAAVIMLFSQWTKIDPLISIGIGLIILAGTWPLMRDSVKVLLQAAPTRISMAEIRQYLLAEPSVSRIDDLHVWELNSGEIIFSATLVALDEVCSLDETQQINEQIRRKLADRFDIHHATLEWRTSSSPSRGCEEQ